MGTLYVSAPIAALVEGIFREDKSIHNLLTHGNLGLGTFNDLDGEMVILDGEAYRIDVDGVAFKVEGSNLSPFACVTHFKPNLKLDIKTSMSYERFLESISEKFRSENFIYALKIHGEFDLIRTRSVPKQDIYRPLVDVSHDQKVTELTNARGTLVGFWTPSFMGSISVAGIHLHFIEDNLRHGGHLLNCYPKSVTVEMQEIHHLNLELPSTKDYGAVEFERDVSKDLNEAEH